MPGKSRRQKADFVHTGPCAIKLVFGSANEIGSKLRHILEDHKELISLDRDHDQLFVNGEVRVTSSGSIVGFLFPPGSCRPFGLWHEDFTQIVNADGATIWSQP